MVCPSPHSCGQACLQVSSLGSCREPLSLICWVMSPVFRNPCFYFTLHFWGVLLCFYIYSAVLLSTGIVNRQNPHLCGIPTVARKMENKQLKQVNYIDMLESLPMVTVAMKLKDDPWKNAITNLDSILNRDIMLLTKVRIIKAMVFSVVMYGCES